MRKARLVGEGRSFYHAVSRVVDGKKVFGNEEKALFRRLLRIQEMFSGVGVLAHCLMSDHFHVFLEVPERDTLAPLDQDSLLALLPLLQDEVVVEAVMRDFERARLTGDEALHHGILARYEARRGDLSMFLKELKLRVTFMMNKRLDRRGTLWEGRYRSVLVEGSENALLTMAAFIDLNPVRSGLLSDPGDYPWSSYGEAVMGGPGSEWARQGLGRMLEESLAGVAPPPPWTTTAERYRRYLFGEADGEGSGNRKRGLLSVPQALRRPVRYFCDAAVLGSEAFVNEVFEREQAARQRFGEKRKTGARRMRGADWGALRVMRDLQKDVMG